MKWQLLFLLHIIMLRLTAQPFQYAAFSTKEGLASNTISSIVKDNKGFLWVGTVNGLNRFDGNAFDVFTNNPTDSNSIASNEIHGIFFDKKNTMWIGTMAGISQYNAAAQTFSNYAPDTMVLPKIGQTFSALNEDADENIWVGTWYDLLIFNPATKKFKSSGWASYAAKVKPQSGNHTRVLVLSIQKKSATDFWVLTTYGLFSVNSKTLQFQYYPNNVVTDYFGSIINYIDEEQNLWIGTYNSGMLCYKSKTNQWKNYTPPPQILQFTQWNIAYGIQPYNGDTLLYCGNNCVVFFDKQKEVFLDALTAKKNNLPPQDFHHIYKDGNTFWLSGSNGLVRMKKEKLLFTQNAIENFSSVDKLFTSASTGLLLINNPGKKLVYYNPEKYSAQPILFLPTAQPTEFNGYKEINTTTAVLSVDEKLYRLNHATQQLTAISLPPKIFANNSYTVRNVVTDKDGGLWIRLRKQGIAYYNPVTKKIVFSNFIAPRQNKEYSALFCDSASNTLAAAVQSEGLYLYQPHNNNLQHLLLNILPSQKGAAINCITGDGKGNLFFTDANYGLFHLNIYTKNIIRYTVTNGLATNNCYWVTFDTKGFLWVASQSGVSRFDTTAKQFLNFGNGQGRQGPADFIVADAKGNMYQPWQNGYYQWNTEDFTTPLPQGKIYLRHCSLNNSYIKTDTIYNFLAKENNISFQFGYLLLSGNDAVHFEYKLNNSNWLPMDNQNTVSFSNLSPNKYQLIVQEKNKPQQQFTVFFTVQPPFYKTLWFISLVALTLTALLFLLVKNRIAAIQKQATLKQKIAETEMMALRAQMSPHFIFNCISSIDNFILDNDKENASNYLNKFAKLIRNILDNSKNDVIPFWKDWDTLQLYLQLEQLRSNNKFTYILHADDDLLNGHYKIPPLIIQPYIENAIHHGLKPLLNKQGQLTITAAIKNGILQYTITDNGIGRQKAAENNFVKPQHQSYGMQLTKERIELFNQQQANSIVITDVKDTDANAAGTQVTVLLKI